jgi:uncharacterized protein (TIGR02145 family)
MKQLITFLFLAISAVVFSQAPQSIPYQAVVRNTDGTAMANAAVTITFKIHDNSATGTVVYEETHTTTSNAQGLVILNVGGGTALTGSFGNINWGNGNKFLQVLMNAGNGVVDLGTQQLMSVPYALYAEDVNVRVSVTGDSLFIGDHVSIVPGVSAANPVPFFTEGSGAVDNQGNSYNTIVVGGQEWLEGYLKSDFFNNGERIDMHDLGQCYGSSRFGDVFNYWGGYSVDTIIPMIADYWLDNGQRAAQDSLFGHYYSVGALVNTKNVCPVNWKVPSSTDIKFLMKSIKSDFDTASNEVSLNQEQVDVFWNELNWKIPGGDNDLGHSNNFDYNLYAYNYNPDLYNDLGPNLIQYGGANWGWVLDDMKLLMIMAWDNGGVTLEILDFDFLGLTLFDSQNYFATKCIKDTTRVQYGCTNPNACNFHNWAQEDDGSCYAPGQNCDDKNGNTYNDVVLGDCTCTGILDTLPGVIGCEDVQVMIEGCNGVSSIEYFGEVYDLVELGGQCWFAEDLKTKFTRDSLPLNYFNNTSTLYCLDVTKPMVFENLSGVYITDASRYNPIAYNQATVVQDKVCPDGWHIPSECEWKYMLGSVGATTEELNSNIIGCQNNVNGNFRMFDSFVGGFGDNTMQKKKSGFNGVMNTAGMLQNQYFQSYIYDLRSEWWFGYEKYLLSQNAWRSLTSNEIFRDNQNPGNLDWDEVFALRCVKGEKQVYGCMDVTACNYNFYANTEDGSCLHVGDVCNDSALQTLNDVINNACECVGQLVLDTIINPGNGVQDIDGNHYSTVMIGNQEWMAENLKTTKYSNGDAINHFERGSYCVWSMLSDIDSVGSYLIYNNENEKNALFGKLYNKIVVEDNRNVCPTGWIVPGFQEWNQLLVYLDPQAQFTDAPSSSGGYSLTAGDQLKSTQTWTIQIPSSNSGFNALASGSGFGESFTGNGSQSFWWVKGNNNQSYFYLYDNSSAAYFGQYFYGASSIRCIKAQ